MSRVSQQEEINRLISERGYGDRNEPTRHIEISAMKLAEEVFELLMALGFRDAERDKAFFRNRHRALVHGTQAGISMRWSFSDMERDGQIEQELADVMVTLCDVEYAARRVLQTPHFDEPADLLAMALRKAGGDAARGVRG